MSQSSPLQDCTSPCNGPAILEACQLLPGPPSLVQLPPMGNAKTYISHGILDLDLASTPFVTTQPSEAFIRFHCGIEMSHKAWVEGNSLEFIRFSTEDSMKKNMSGTKVGNESAKIQLGGLSSKAFDGLDLNLSDGIQVDQVEGLLKASMHQRQTLLSTKRDRNSSGSHAKGNEVQGDGMMQNSMFRFPFKDGKDSPFMGSSSSAVLSLPAIQKQPLISPKIADRSGEMNLHCIMNSASSSKLAMPINPYIPMGLSNINTNPSLKSASSSKLAMPNNSDISLSLSNINTNPRPFQTQFLFEKTLTRSGVSAINRLIIPKKIAEAYFLSPQACENNPIREMLEVFDSENTKWDFILEIWQKSHSYVMSNWWKAFVNKHKLKAKDVICFYKLDSSFGNITRSNLRRL